MNTMTIVAQSKAHPLLLVTRLYDGGAIIMRSGKDAHKLSERQARRIDRMLTDDLGFRSWYCQGGRTFAPLTPAERRAKLAARHRATQARKRRALAPAIHGWTGHWQRR